MYRRAFRGSHIPASRPAPLRTSVAPFSRLSGITRPAKDRPAIIDQSVCSAATPPRLPALPLQLKKIHPHRSLGRSGRRHSTAGGRDVSRQYVSHSDRNTDHVRAPGISAEDERSAGRRRQGDPTGIRPTRVRSCTTIELLTFWSHDWRMRGASSRPERCSSAAA